MLQKAAEFMRNKNTSWLSIPTDAVEKNKAILEARLFRKTGRGDRENKP
jgi:hypothetical protein